MALGYRSQRNIQKTCRNTSPRLKRTIGNGGIYYHGTYQYVPGSTFHFNPITSNVVVVGKVLAFVTGWKLAPETHNSKKLSKGWGPQKSYASLMVVKDFLNDSVQTGHIVNRCARTWFTDLIKRLRCRLGVASRTIIWSLVKQARVGLVPLFHRLHRRTALER
ncbi:colicin D domain-containing protein [Acidovorax sp. 94]|uniref:colicin D domain-containing protein n=1 Tax=Acidovorax sp. 94 TaxID=2135633 RepID=UPI000EB3CAE2